MQWWEVEEPIRWQEEVGILLTFGWASPNFDVIILLDNELTSCTQNMQNMKIYVNSVVVTSVHAAPPAPSRSCVVLRYIQPCNFKNCTVLFMTFCIHSIACIASVVSLTSTTKALHEYNSNSNLSMH